MTQIIKYDPFAEMQALQRQFFGDDWFSPKSLQLPTTDIYTKDDKQLIAEVHLPHFSENDIDVRVDKGALEIQAERHEKEEDKSKKYVVRESSSSFYRRFQLPEMADENNIEAHFEDGVLKVTVPFKKLPAPKKISVKKNDTKTAKK
ncbi:MAG: Hsp20/alpha crystallin family protein [Patescibacteria group bacterium]|jgi:HSP20 family protein|nr:Hsp20/alpha crystallin family protein [Patescibacteria group bacterium]